MTPSRPATSIEEFVQRLSSRGLLLSVSGAGEFGDAGGVTGGVVSDSRNVTAGCVFVAIRGDVHDGHRYVAEAVSRGAAAVVVEGETGSWPGTPVMRVSDSRKALAQLAAAWYGDPAQSVRVTGVTGTNGKTTTAWLLAQALEKAGQPCGYVGTIGYGRAGNLQDATHTTPGADALQALLASLRDEGCSAAAIEASSHAIDQHRTASIPFAAAVFTNLTRDHLDYHGDTQSYLNAKARLFEELGPDAVSAINIDDEAGRAIAGRSAGQVIPYGRGAEAAVRFSIRSDGPSGLKLRLDGHDVNVGLSGAFNAYNLAGAYAALQAYGLSPAERLDALAAAEPAPGRFQILRLKRERSAIIDYAHTPDALDNVLSAARGIVPTGARLWCVFGCGGDRDSGKRPLMGAIAEKLADRVVVTSDNPRTEDPEAILEDVRVGFREPERVHWVVDRRAAIRLAVTSSGVGDVIVVAGKGPEPYQIIGTDRLPFLDEKVVRDAEAG